MTRAIPCLLVALAACTPKQRCGAGPTRVELRDGAGVLTGRVAESGKAGELEICDPGGQRVGSLLREGEVVRLFDRSHAERLRGTSGASEALGPDGTRLRLYRHQAHLRVLKPDGVAYASLFEKDDEVLVSDASGTPVAKVSARDADAVVADQDGHVQAFLVPSPGLLAASALAVPELALEERVFLAAHLQTLAAAGPAAARLRP